MLITLLLYVPSRRGRECFVRAARSEPAASVDRDRPDAVIRVFFVNEDHSQPLPKNGTVNVWKHFLRDFRAFSKNNIFISHSHVLCACHRLNFADKLDLCENNKW